MCSLLKRPLVVLVETLAAAALLSACGGGGSEEPTAAAGQVALASGDEATADGASATGAEAASEDEPVSEGSELAAAELNGVDQPAIEDAGGLEAAMAADTEREQAQTLSVDSSDLGYAKPKVAAVDYENNNTTSRRDLLAKYKFVILGARGSRADDFASYIKSKSSSTKVAAYTVFNELKCGADSSSYYYPMVKEANSANFWLRYASGSRTAWTSDYGACDMNISRWGRKNSDGRTWMQEKARFDYDRMYRSSSIDYVFSDNTFYRPRVDADWKRIGTNQSRNLSDIQAAQRAGHAAYWSAIRAKRSSVKIMANADRDLSHYEYKDKLQGAFFEAAMGRSWSLESWAGWGPMMQRYRALIRNTVAPNDVLFQVKASTTNYRLVRYGLASAMLENGWFVYGPSSGTIKPHWFDEFDARIGKPTQSPPTSAKANGVWMRKYENGLVLVNPTTSSRSIYVGSGYKRLKGTQDPGVNNGYRQSTVTLPAKSGLLMIRS
jgi:hypothetical protein